MEFFLRVRKIYLLKICWKIRNFIKIYLLLSMVRKKQLYFYDKSDVAFWNHSELNNVIELGYPTELEPFFLGM